MELQDQRVLVTGATAGIGQEAAKLFQATVPRPGYGCTASTWNTRACLTPCQLGFHRF